MDKLTKGEKTQSEILERVNAFFNQNGVGHTIARISVAIGMNKSRITNYFPKKEHLVLSLLENYESQMAALFARHQYDEGIFDFNAFIPLLSDAMELMFHYRGAISYGLTNHQAMDDGISRHIRASYASNKERVRNRLELFVRNGLVKRHLLDPTHFETYFFQYMCMSSNWIITHNLLYADQAFEAVKPRYLRAILCCLQPYLTEKGRENLETALPAYEELPTLE